ncbi:MAG: histidinol dehydrogenase [Acidobacteria bacterium]|nr:histidinol dehydrogenase [Acidobacteriota bacterium]
MSRDGEAERDTQATVAAILAEVRAEGLPAVLRHSQRLDGVCLEPGTLRVPPQRCRESLERLRKERPALISALEDMSRGIRRFAEAQRAALQDVTLSLPGGGTVGERWVPLGSVGVYVPGGRAFYPSTLAMTVIPAQVAGVPRIVAVTPPRPEGADPLVLATAALLGLEVLVTLGGAQAVGWLAFVEEVDLVAGPGNRFVAEAKRQIQGACGIDSVAGPTEVLVLADGGADPDRVAEDLLAQAEHDPDAASVLVSDDEGLLQAVARRLAARVEDSPRRDILRASLSRHGRLVLADRETAVELARLWAPEHLELQVRDPEAWLPGLLTAGAVFIGSDSAEAFGDYGAGPNHVLPTNRSARFSSPLGVATFLKRQSLIRLSADDAATLAPWVAELAVAEGLPHHAQSARLRAPR